MGPDPIIKMLSISSRLGITADLRETTSSSRQTVETSTENHEVLDSPRGGTER